MSYRLVETLDSNNEQICVSQPGQPDLDDYLSQQVLLALKPAALELSLAAAERMETDRADLDKHWQQRLERTAFEA